MQSFNFSNFHFFESGDPTARSWFLVSNGYLPLTLCTLYVVGTKYVGPFIMKERKPFDLRLLMIFYNFVLVVIYIYGTSNALYLLLLPENSWFLCKKFIVIEGNNAYKLVSLAYIVYILKYVEFLDTIFFVLRKKNHLISNLHMIHHASVPLILWCLARTETNAFQGIALLLNSIVHTIMYIYYGLAAMGPTVRPYLWWKKYVTILQMAQFVLILFFIGVISPLLGCKISAFTIILQAMVAILFFSLFFNFYRKTFLRKHHTAVKKVN